MNSKKTSMGGKIAIISNGELDNISFTKRILKSVDMIICADGGANHIHKLKIEPDYIIGDFDSIKKSVLSYYKKSKKTVIISDPNQDYTDTEAAIKLAKVFKPKEIIFLCAIGNRIDHTLANIFCLEQTKRIKSSIINSKNSIELIENETITINAKKNDIISVIPLTNTKNITYTGLKWNLKNHNTKLGWVGICNKMTKKTATITVKKGKILIIKSKD